MMGTEPSQLKAGLVVLVLFAIALLVTFAGGPASAVLAAVDPKIGLGDRLSQGSTSLPLNILLAQAQGWTHELEGTCTPGLGNAYALNGVVSMDSPLLLYFTAAGQISGFGTDVFGSAPQAWDSGLVFWDTVDEEHYRIAIGTRSVLEGDVCDPTALFHEAVGTVAKLSPSGANWGLPLTESEATAQAYTAGSCTTTVGDFFAYDFASPGHFKFSASTTLPVYPLFDFKTGKLTGVEFWATSAQVGWDVAGSSVTAATLCEQWCASPAPSLGKGPLSPPKPRPSVSAGRPSVRGLCWSEPACPQPTTPPVLCLPPPLVARCGACDWPITDIYARLRWSFNEPGLVGCANTPEGTEPFTTVCPAPPLAPGGGCTRCWIGCGTTCAYAGDGDCDDGGGGSEYDLCDPCTDCGDCGERTEAECESVPPTPAPPAPPAPPVPVPVPVVEGPGCGASCTFVADGECDDGGEGSAFDLCDPCTDCFDCGPRLRGECATSPISPPAPSAPVEEGPGCGTSCMYADDGECDDGGEESNYYLCDPCTDCGDCGTRDAAACELARLSPSSTLAASPSPPSPEMSCSTACQYGGDGECDDGGEGSEFSLCGPCNDCEDCGPRDATSCVLRPSPSMPAPADSDGDDNCASLGILKFLCGRRRLVQRAAGKEAVDDGPAAGMTGGEAGRRGS